MGSRFIGKVEMDYTYYDPEIVYSDGDIEEELLEAAKNDTIDNLLENSGKYAVLYHFSKIRENVLEWYPFDKSGKLLEVGSGCGALTGLFAKKVKKVTCIELSERRSEINAYRNRDADNIKIFLGKFEDIEITEKYDYITLIGVWEYSGLYVSADDPYVSMIKQLIRHLKPDGKIIIAIENKMGLKYWNGAREDHTSKTYDGLNDYINTKKIRTFSKNEIVDILNEARIKKYKFYYPNPDYKLPDTIYSDDRLPKVGEIRNYRKDYDCPRIYNFSDAAVVDQICADKMFPYFANSFVIECGLEEMNYSNVLYAKYSRNRNLEYQISTIICQEDDIIVKKKALNEAAEKHLKYHEEKYINGKTIEEMFYAYRGNVNRFIDETKEVLNNYLKPSEMKEFVFTPEYKELFGEQYVKDAKSQNRTNIDMIFSNLIVDGSGRCINIDKEWEIDFPVPYEYVLWRAVDQLYSTYSYYLRPQISRRDFISQVGIKIENVKIYNSMEKSFYKYVIGRDRMKLYRKPCARLSDITIVQ